MIGRDDIHARILCEAGSQFRGPLARVSPRRQRLGVSDDCRMVWPRSGSARRRLRWPTGAQALERRHRARRTRHGALKPRRRRVRQAAQRSGRAARRAPHCVHVRPVPGPVLPYRLCGDYSWRVPTGSWARTECGMELFHLAQRQMIRTPGWPRACWVSRRYGLASG